MEGKAHVLHKPFCFLLAHKIPKMELIIFFIASFHHGMEQIIVHIVCSQILKLLCEYILHLVFCLNEKGWKLYGDGKLTLRIPFYHTLP